MQDAINILRKGGIVVFPTDTAYGLGGAYDDPHVIERILEVKKRTKTRFTIIAASLGQVLQYFELSPKALELAHTYWPGPLSIVVNDQYSVRVPDHLIARRLAEGLGKPIIATSANLSGQPENYDIASAQKELGEENVDAWIDGGVLPTRPVSTIVKVEGKKVKIIRQGAVTL